MEKHTIYFELKEELERPDCPICVLREKAVDGYMDTLLYEEVNDVGVREQIRKARGFCRLHSWQLRAMGDPLAHAIIYRDLINDALKMLSGSLMGHVKLAGRSFLRGTKSLEILAGSLKQKTQCPVCRRARETEVRYLSSLLNYLRGDKGMREAYEKSDGLCFPHFIEALENSDTVVAEYLIAKERALLQGLAEDLERLRQKFDYRFSGKPWAGEEDSWIRAVKHWVGLLALELR